MTSSKNLYVAPTASTCDYRAYIVASKSVTCAVSASITPYISSLEHIMMVGGPVAYCPNTLTNANSSCVAVVKDSQVITEDVFACTKQITIIRPGKLGDYVWLDADKDGIQDFGES